MKATKNWSKALLAGMAALVLAFGLVLAGCDNGTGGGGGNTSPKSITITGITGISGEWEVHIFSSFNNDEFVEGSGTIANGSLKVGLKENGKDWTGSGNYFVFLDDPNDYEDSNGRYAYTNGKTFTDLGISVWDDRGKLPKLSINSASTLVAFNEFRDIYSLWP